LSKKKIIITLPAYNEENYVANVVLGARRFADDVVVIDDGSDDNTAEVARAVGASILSHGIRRGYGECIKSCFNLMKQRNADVLVTIDADGQHVPDEIPRLLIPIINGEAEVVIGSRFLGEKTNIPSYRKFGINLITFLCNFCSQVKYTDAQSGFRAYSKEVLEKVNIKGKGMGASVEVLINLREKGFRIKEVPISCSYHSGGSTLNPLVHGIGVVVTVLRIRINTILRKLCVG
jgi:glycosyltransferase involved in cell wall biosynthesis